jgi:hypothetical protein
MKFLGTKLFVCQDRKLKFLASLYLRLRETSQNFSFLSDKQNRFVPKKSVAC